MIVVDSKIGVLKGNSKILEREKILILQRKAILPPFGKIVNNFSMFFTSLWFTGEGRKNRIYFSFYVCDFRTLS